MQEATTLMPQSPRDALSERVAAKTYLDLIGRLIGRVDEDLITLSVGAHADSADEREARRDLYGLLFEARDALLRAMTKLQAIVHPGARFSLGRIVMTDGVNRLVGHDSVGDVLRSLVYAQHAQGKWGELDAHDRQANEDALSEGMRLLSVYTVQDERVYVITEADRSLTTVLLASEY